ncbi:nondiscriminating glutamyl-tRNA synthetase [Paenibacillus shirakamiensis]|uniref:Glutamate--tRNA ligase n=1 Tax=Paenibacillus shirakamiensis TaxID=1265935 RepID=A0ABS4JLM7_9BACL|nr:glutamate--tRNA ligase [Paenibacillus shirakamiensis]MBP2002610.1 nondiscriminating glutamyl-tRNA synthetase [Paenibacillus shirakamiensis]
MTEVRVRYAPSPTGHLHIGNARTALFNYLYARSLGGTFIIRIEDTDTKRNIEGGEQSQLKYLRWLGMDWDESVDVGGNYGPYRQTERLDLYRTYWQELLDKDLAYRCYCTEEELEKEREEQTARGEMPRYAGQHSRLTQEQQQAFEAEGRVASIRFRVPEDKTYAFDDMVKGPISFESNVSGDFVIVKKDGIPTYNFAVAVDDHLMKISHVLRGEDHISNTPRQLMIYEALGWEPPVFGHMTLIYGDNHKKLSKRDESVIQFIEQYDQLGYLPEAMFNFIALLGWSPEGEEEIFSKEELISIFDAHRLSKSPAVFDKQKLAHINNVYIKKADPERIAELAIPQLQKASRLPAELSEEKLEWAKALVALYQEQMTSASEITELSDVFFRTHLELESDAAVVLSEPQVPDVLRAFVDKIEASSEFTAQHMAVLIKEVQKETGFKGKQLFMPIRVALTGQTHGRDLNQTIYLLGRDRVIDRLKSQIRGA